MIIVGISQWHNSSICILENGEIKLHIENERLSKIKYDLGYSHLLKFIPPKFDVLCVAGVSKTINVGDEIKKKIENTGYKNFSYYNIWNTHHLFHASCAFYNSGFDKAICIIKDGMGSEFYIKDKRFLESTYGRESATTFLAEYPNNFSTLDKHITVNFDCNEKLDNVCKINNSGSEALLYQKTSKKFGFQELDAGKVMGMSAYGKSEGNQIYEGNFINKNLLSFNNNDLRQGYINKEFLNFKEKCNFAYDVQKQTQNKIKNYILEMVEKTGIKNVCLSGGYFLNCVANYYFLKKIPADIKIYVEPISNDSGTSIGIAKYMWHSLTKEKKIIKQKSIYYGNKSKLQEKDILELFKNHYVKKTNAQEVATIISKDNLVALFQGSCESGPRSLGNRSLLFNPCSKNGKDLVNTIKKRESFRPFAATILKEEVKNWFDISHLEESKFMMYAVNCINTEKIPAVLHIDNTCRIQTLLREDNIKFYDLINEFYKITNIPMLLNTSLNLAGYPIINSYEDLLELMKNCSINYYYLPDFEILIVKKYINTL